MHAHIIDGKALALLVTDEVRLEDTARVAAGPSVPGRPVVLVSHNAASQCELRTNRRTPEAARLGSVAPDPSSPPPAP